MSQILTDVCAPPPDPLSLQDAAIALNLISSEAGHEVVQTLNYLRFLVRNKQSSGVTSEIIDFAVPEIDPASRTVGSTY